MPRMIQYFSTRTGDSFDEDTDLVFTPKQISIVRSAMMDILKVFKGYRDQGTDLNQTLDNLSVLPQDVQYPLKDPGTPLLVIDIAPILMTGTSDTHASSSGIKRTQNQTLIIPLRKTHSAKRQKSRLTNPEVLLQGQTQR